MTLCGKPLRGFHIRAWKSLRDYHIPTASAAAALFQISNQKGNILSGLPATLQAHPSIGKGSLRIDCCPRTPLE
jgi:hypothetical protein